MKCCRHCSKPSVTRPRGLCWVCYYAPGVKEQYPVTSKYARRAETDLSMAAARLYLWSALLWATETGSPTGLEPDQWVRLLDGLLPREVFVVAMHVIRGLTFREIGEWMGTTHSVPSKVWVTAAAKLRASSAMGAI